MADAKKHHIVHDKPLIKSLLSSFIVLIISGLAISQLVALFVEHHLPLEHSTEENASTWKHMEWKDGIETLRRPIAGTQLYAHKAVTTVDVPLGVVMKVIRDTPHQSEWVRDLQETEEFHKSAHHKDESHEHYEETAIVRHKYKFAIPGVKPREFLMSRTLTTTEAKDGSGRTSVEASFISFADEKEEFPVCDGCVRAHNLGSTWTFTAVDGGKKTKIEAAVAVDPHLKNLSQFFVNAFQMRWPRDTVHRLVNKLMADSGKHEGVIHQAAHTMYHLKD
mmetsp:Transcript_34779/g.76112  ORF Transcript_34779/g.76112 Transcript_34779/m.76112 type:complete len:278 (-) Transcript_34779:6-839(-)|eukprot:CAMPEP_0178477920 /NCGR_PEP_ID=MMETSP0696-20121128/4388_1 /TAXON_ID=265572 /ORGANISM="Extubocellulus spinifer, Strain CCMP396" /LENGTH=277 /DNA_ID=CAMNT_0020105263 /DNA_START=122 /DNA_END=955 /DNA_ORIENTATION=-